MVKSRRYPAGCRMAIVAGVAAGDVVDRLAARNSTIMTATACAAHRSMINLNNRCPCRSGMAIVAIVRADDVSSGFARSCRAVMAAIA